MTSYLDTITRPAGDSGARARSLRRTGLVVGGVGVGVAALAFIASLAASDRAGGGTPDEVAAGAILAFGLATAGFATIKLGISVVLLGIIRRLWVRVGAVRSSLPAFIAAHGTNPGPDAPVDPTGPYVSPQGPATATRTAPEPPLIHRIAKLAWLPMLVMGVMLVGLGFLIDLAAVGEASAAGAASSAFAWAQGVMFLGETMLLAGISFLLGTILASIRSGGGEAQQSLGLTVHTLQMPTTAKVFIGLMVAGVMVGMIQFLGYAVVALGGDIAGMPAAFAALGPLREFGLGLLLAGIVLALATIGTALRFQFDRLSAIISTGRQVTEVPRS